MIRFLTLVFLTYIFSTNIFAKDQQSVAIDDAIKKVQCKRINYDDFLSTYARFTNYKIGSKLSEQVAVRVYALTSKNCDPKSHVPAMDKFEDTCWNACNEYANNVIQKAVNYVSFHSKLTDCRNICRAYSDKNAAMEVAIRETFESNSLKNKPTMSPDCTGAVDTSKRGNPKANIFDGALEKEHSFNTGAIPK